MNRKIVITGIGVLSPVAIGRDAYWQALNEGKSGFGPITLFDASSFQTRFAGEVKDFDAAAFLGKKGLRDLDRSTRLICSAAKLAIDDGVFTIDENCTHNVGVSIGSTFGSLHSISQFDRSGLIEGPRAVNPSHFPNTVINSPASQVSIRFKIKGFNTTISTGFCASLDALAYAADFIRLNRADAVLAGGVEELCEETFSGFYQLGCLSGTDGSEPRCRPFDARRNGMILSEGAAVLILEAEEHAGKRGAAILARVLGYASAFDPSADSHWNHEGQGLQKAITDALKDASLVAEDIDYISACANSSKGLDRLETSVIKRVFGEYSRRVPVSAVKSMIGESFSASGALAAAAAVGALHSGSVPPTVNYFNKDRECDLEYVSVAARPKRINNVLVTAVDPYGQNAALILGR
jgi:3-oxoacyl-[acyl-carrier-protein] synthase II